MVNLKQGKDFSFKLLNHLIYILIMNYIKNVNLWKKALLI